MLPWYRHQRVRFLGAALLAGLVIGGLVTLALGYQGSSPSAIPERSDAAAIASDQAAAPTPTATATSAPKKAKPAKKAKRAKDTASVPVSAATAEPTATSTPDDEELGGTPAPVRAAPRRQAAQKIVSKPRGQITPVKKKTPAKPAPAPRPAAPAPTPAPTSAPAPASTPAPTPEPHRPPHGHHGGGDDDDPGQP